LRGRFVEIIQRNVKLAQELREKLEEFDRETSSLVIKSVIDGGRESFPYPEVVAYVDEVIEHATHHLPLFRGKPQNAPEELIAALAQELKAFAVNVVLDNSRTESTPVVVETQPNFTNLFGTIERFFDGRGAWQSDFTQIKGGSLLAADGGFLVVNALDALQEPGVWKTLKRALLYSKLEIQTLDSAMQTMPTALKPEAIPLNIKVIMIGDESLYHQLYAYGEEFDSEMLRSPEAIQDYARFIARMCEQEHLLHFAPSGVAAVVDYGTRRAGRQNKLTTQFSDVGDLIREAHYHASLAGATLIVGEHVELSLRAGITRSGRSNDSVQEMILDHTLLIDTSGERVGQVNGLAVYQLGNIAFGKPARITASVGAGRAGIINIEREAGMSGSIHDKGVYILSGFFRERFSSDKPLTFSASIGFEQSYGGIDGDSASSTEIYALLSAFSGVPIKQQYAVTGSVNQKGDIQPIGGVNEKIEGYFDVCAARGLTGAQGVIIPKQNVADLMLRRDVIDAVSTKQFAIYAVSSIEEGIEVLTGIPAGNRGEQGYPKDSLFGKVDIRLKELHALTEEEKPTLARKKNASRK
jgi:lon-related putative ATP-dependent protease